MDLLTKLPAMSDDALTNLGSNAERLMRSGTPKQKAAASALLPAVKGEQGARRASKQADIKTKPAASAGTAAGPRRRKKKVEAPSEPEPLE